MAAGDEPVTVTRTGPFTYRPCRCGGFHAVVPCAEDEAREEKRAAFRAQLEAKRATVKSSREPVERRPA